MERVAAEEDAGAPDSAVAAEDDAGAPDSAVAETGSVNPVTSVAANKVADTHLEKGFFDETRFISCPLVLQGSRLMALLGSRLMALHQHMAQGLDHAVHIVSVNNERRHQPNGGRLR